MTNKPVVNMKLMDLLNEYRNTTELNSGIGLLKAHDQIIELFREV